MKGRDLSILAVLGVAVALALVARQRGSVCPPPPGLMGTAVAGSVSPGLSAVGLPRLVDLGSDKCVPCRMMAPILEDLRKSYDGRFEVTFVDVWEQREVGEKHGVRVIPTQIFYGPSGKELWRHEGFLSKEDILGKWKELGFPFEGTVPPSR